MKYSYIVLSLNSSYGGRWLSSSSESTRPEFTGENAYDILGVSESSSLADIKASFHKLAKQTHPDLARHSNAFNSHRFIQILAAYEVKHMHWYGVGDRVSIGECRCSRARLPPSNRFWLFEPRCEMHDIGGWYVETFGRDKKGRTVPSRRFWDGFDGNEQYDKYMKEHQKAKEGERGRKTQLLNLMPLAKLGHQCSIQIMQIFHTN